MGKILFFPKSSAFGCKLFLLSFLLTLASSYANSDDETANDGAVSQFGRPSDNSSSECIDRRLTYPSVIDMDVLAEAGEAATFDLEWIEINPGFGDSHGYKNDASEQVCGTSKFKTRALGGSIPGPTLTVSPGTTMKILFRNKLTYQPESFSSHIVVDKKDSEGNHHYHTTSELDVSRLNKFNDPDIGNFHFHGLHISAALPSDDATLNVLPGEEYLYTVTIPEDHEPGMHWVHSHHHGSTTVHFMGGATMAVIVKDSKQENVEELQEPESPVLVNGIGRASEIDTMGNETEIEEEAETPTTSSSMLPQEIRDATERIMIFQEFDIKEAEFIARSAGDRLLLGSFLNIEGGDSIGKRFVTINGKYQPILNVPVGKWERWRILYAGWQDLPMRLGITGSNLADCEFYLLAKDGIYISDYPRGPMAITDGELLPIPPAGRADFMVRCNKAGGTSRFEALSRRNVLVVNAVEGDGDDAGELANNNIPKKSNINVVEGETTSPSIVQTRSKTPLTPWGKAENAFPEYLKDTTTMVASTGCTCETHMEGYDTSSRINGQMYWPGNNFMHTSYLGATVERHLKGTNDHSYHQHVYPFQLIDVPNKRYADDPVAYLKVGDWQDTYLDKNQNLGYVTIRYRAVDFPGKVMVHCHDALHSDRGVMQKEYIRSNDEGYNGCECDIFGPIGGRGVVDQLDLEIIGVSNVVPNSGAVSSNKILLFLATAVSAILLLV